MVGQVAGIAFVFTLLGIFVWVVAAPALAETQWRWFGHKPGPRLILAYRLSGLAGVTFFFVVAVRSVLSTP